MGEWRVLAAHRAYRPGREPRRRANPGRKPAKGASPLGQPGLVRRPAVRRRPSRRAPGRQRQWIHRGPDRSVLHLLVRDGDRAQLGLRQSRRPGAARRERWHAGRAEPRELVAGDHGRRDHVCVPAPPRHPLLGRDARQGERLPARIRKAVTRGDPPGCRGTPRRFRRLREAAAELRSQPGYPDGRRDRDDRLPPPTAGARVPVCSDPRVSNTARHAGPEYGDASGRLDRAVHDRELRAGTGAHARPQPLLRRVGESRSPGRVPRRDPVQTDRPARRHGHRTRAGRRRIPFFFPDGGCEGACGVSSALPVAGPRASGAGDRLPLPQYDTSSVRRCAGAASRQLRHRPWRHFRVVRGSRVRRADLPAPRARHRGLPALLPLHCRPGPDGRMEGASPGGCAPPCRRLRDARHEGDDLDVPRLLGAGRGGSGPSAREAGLPGEHQAGRGVTTPTGQESRTRRRGGCRQE